MSFQPDKITREHIIEAINELDKQVRKLQPSTKFDVLYEGKLYPPKELLRQAHQFATGEYLWERSGGSETNDFLASRGFVVQPKSERSDPFPALIREYKDLINRQGMEDELYKWELIETFKGMPDPDASDFAAEVKRVNFSNLIYGPGIGVVQQLARLQTDVYKQLYRDLFNEEVELQQRIDTFASAVTFLYRQVEPDPKRQPHHDERTVSTLLTFHNPYKYAFYKDSFYRTLCKVTGEKIADPGKKYVHYLAIVNSFINNYIQDDKELIELVNGFKSPQAFEDPNHTILAQDILYRMLEINGRTVPGLFEEIAITLEDDTASPGFRLMRETAGNEKNRDWVWVTDGSGLLGQDMAHYELEIIPLKRDKIRVCLHFEENNNKRFLEAIGSQLPEGLEWFTWFKAKSIRMKEEISFYGEHTVLDVISALKLLDKEIGDRVRDVIKTINRKKNPGEMQNDQPLNQILYGPPGTGKTYHTINKTLQILGKYSDQMSRKDMKEEFDRMIKQERVVFTTFHQSLGYEDFIEGIKPVETDDITVPIQYETRPGIFKTICKNALGLQEVKAQSEDIFKKAKFYKMSLGGLQNPHIHDWCIKNNCVGLGWGGDRNFDDLKTIKVWKDYRDKFTAQHPDLVAESRYNITAMYAFQKMGVGDIVVISKGNHVIDAIGKITSDYYWSDHNDFEYYQFRNVEWLATNLNQQPGVFFTKKISQQSIYEFFDDDVKKEVFIELFKSEVPDVKPYVLIIDEINRGNVSKIFGELITLLEPDKRLGNDEVLKVTLPYSRDSFGVPANLYIIGTMNTADRSVEALDTALRRRFSFEEMQPMPDLLSSAHTIWRFFWKHEKKNWDDKSYLSEEAKLFNLLGVSEDLKNERYEIWKSFSKTDRPQEQIGQFERFVYTGINLKDLLITINKRLEILKDRDHQIGHAYFMHVFDMDKLMSVFRDSLIPLLQEYFFGDYHKIQLVMGIGFITAIKPDVKFAVNDDGQFEDSIIYQINATALSDPGVFATAYSQMNI